MTVTTLIDLLDPIPDTFSTFLDQRGVVYPYLTQVDLLASTLSSQFVLFAGPSGTGKSTAAAALSEFFASSPYRRSFDVERQWGSAADLVGQYSTLIGKFVGKDGLTKLLEIGSALPAGKVPFLTFEEANLSPFEGYLNQVVHGLSGVALEELTWRLHAMSSGVTTVAGTQVPESVKLGPFPRFFGTINVDQTAQAPAKKVSGRSCVVLLEPVAQSQVGSAVGALWPSSGAATPLGEDVIGDPRDALASLVSSRGVNTISGPLQSVLDGLKTALGTNVVSIRDENRCLLYMAYFHKLASSSSHLTLDPADVVPVAAENAVLHFVLPGLTGAQFAQAVGHFEATAVVGGLLRDRATRLSSTLGEHSFGVPIDFWSSLT